MKYDKEKINNIVVKIADDEIIKNWENVELRLAEATSKCDDYDDALIKTISFFHSENLKNTIKIVVETLYKVLNESEGD